MDIIARGLSSEITAVEDLSSLGPLQVAHHRHLHIVTIHLPADIRLEFFYYPGLSAYNIKYDHNYKKANFIWDCHIKLKVCFLFCKGKLKISLYLVLKLIV